jgi:hypothetical protein
MDQLSDAEAEEETPGEKREQFFCEEFTDAGPKKDGKSNASCEGETSTHNDAYHAILSSQADSNYLRDIAPFGTHKKEHKQCILRLFPEFP